MIEFFIENTLIGSKYSFVDMYIYILQSTQQCISITHSVKSVRSFDFCVLFHIIISYI